MSRLALDRGYETGAVHRGLELLGITGYIPAIQFSNPPEKYGFSYDPQLDAFICPEGVPLTYHRLKLQQIDGQISAVLPGRGRCLYALSKTAGLFLQGWNSAQSAGQQLLSGIFQRASARGNSRIPGHDAAS